MPGVDRMDGRQPEASTNDAMERDAVFSSCRTYRYSLIRQWAPGKATNDDPTIRRCIAFTRGWGYGSLLRMDIPPTRSTYPPAWCPWRG